MRMNEWFPEWVEVHRTRHPGAFLPSYDTEEGRIYFDAWRVNLKSRGIMDRDVLDAASAMLAGEVLKSPRDHLPTLIRLAVDIYKQRQAAAGAPTASDPTGRESAERESRNCPSCGGNGLATAWRPTPDPERREPATVAGYCDDCPFGRWLEETHRTKVGEVRKRLKWRSELLRLGWLDHPPGLDDDAIQGMRHFTPSELIRAWTDAARDEPRAVAKAPEPKPRDVRRVQDHDRILDGPTLPPSPPEASEESTRDST